MIVLAIPPVEATLCVTSTEHEMMCGPPRCSGCRPYKRLISLSARDARRVEVGARVAIAATKKKPEEAEWTLPYPPWTMWLDEFGVRVLQHYTFTDANTIATYKAWPLPLGAIVGSAVVEAVVPIVEWVSSRGGLHLSHDGQSLSMAPPQNAGWDDLSDQLAYNSGLTPGRWAVLLTDAAPASERCPCCGGCGDDPGLALAICGVCDGHGICDPIPYTATGRVGKWDG